MFTLGVVEKFFKILFVNYLLLLSDSQGCLQAYLFCSIYIIEVHTVVHFIKLHVNC